MNKKTLLLLVACVACSAAFAQNISTPYSMYGYGIIGDRATSMQRQMGSVGYAMQSGRQINVMNPASYAAIDSLTFLFDIGADFAMIKRKNQSVTENSYGGGLDYVTMQFPLSKHFGGSIGMLPYSGVGYAFGSDVTHGTLENQGNGGINMAYLGLAASYFGVSLGFNVSYNFGNIINDIYTNPTSGRSLFEHVMQIRDWDINIGLQYRADLTKNDRLVIGATYAPKKTILGRSWATIQEMTMEQLPDTVGYLNLKDNYYTPTSIGAGVSYVHERTWRLSVELDYTFQQWSKAKYSPMRSMKDPANIIFQGMDFYDRSRYALGAEFIPNMRGKYYERMRYRIGAYYADDYLNIQGNRLREYGITCGVGLHTPSDKTIINFGLEWKHRSAHPTPLITENYFNITLGVNFNELWFYQRKIK